jgi:hypothetical protein
MYCKMRYSIILNCLLIKNGYFPLSRDETFNDQASSIYHQQSQ